MIREAIVNLLKLYLQENLHESGYISMETLLDISYLLCNFVLYMNENSRARATNLWGGFVHHVGNAMVCGIEGKKKNSQV